MLEIVLFGIVIKMPSIKMPSIKMHVLRLVCLLMGM